MSAGVALGWNFLLNSIASIIEFQTGHFAIRNGPFGLMIPFVGLFLKLVFDFLEAVVEVLSEFLATIVHVSFWYGIDGNLLYACL